MIQVKAFVFNPFQENTYVVYNESRECLIFDPGCYFKEEQQKLVQFISEHHLKPAYIIHTHGHVDHALGVNFLKHHFTIEALMHADDLEVLRKSSDFGESIGIEVDQPSDPERFIQEGETIQLGDTEFDVLHVPGHSPGSVALLNKDDQMVFVGDVLFKQGIGRTDLMGGDFDTLIESIRNKLLVLDDNVVVYPGHGEPTTIGEEKRENPFVN